MEDIGVDGVIEENATQHKGSYFDDDVVPRVRLEKELAIKDLTSGAEFSVDTDLPPEYEGEFDYKNDEVYKYLNPEFEEENDEGTEEGSFERWESKMEDITTDQDKGVMKSIIKQGSGEVVPSDAFVTINYNAYLEGLDEPFDSTYLRGRHLRFPLGKGNVVAGLEIAVPTMKKNETSRFIFKPEYFLGPSGCPPRIPAKTPVMFIVELKTWEECGGADEYYTMSYEERREASFSLVAKVAQREKNEGNDHYRAERWRPALRSYNNAIRLCEDAHLKDEQEEKMQRKLLFQLYKNAALAGLKMKYYKGPLANMSKALDSAPNDAQCLYIKGKAMHGLGHYEKAKRILQRAQSLKPNSHDISNELQKLEENMKAFKFSEKQMYSKMFSCTSKVDENVNSKINKKCNKDSDDGFQQTAQGQLTAFIENAALQELPLPSDLSASHMITISELCEKFGLELREVSSGNNLHYRVVKPDKI